MQSKPGYKTTEMWVTIISQVIAVIVVSINMIYGKELDVSVFTQVVSTAGAFVYAVFTAVWYIRSRATIKVTQNARSVQGLPMQ